MVSVNSEKNINFLLKMAVLITLMFPEAYSASSLISRLRSMLV
jgi:hypothetical protein